MPGIADTLYDFNGDGQADFVLYEYDSGTWYMLESSSTAIRQAEFGRNDMRPVPADYDGDGKTDLAVYHRATGMWYVLCSSSWQICAVQFGSINMRPVPADYDGDGKADPAVYCQETGMWYVLCSSSWQIGSVQLGSTNMRPVPADYDGDGKADPAVYCRATGMWYVLCSSSWQIGSVQLGSRNMRPVPADYDGDGITDIAVFDNENGVWYILESSSWSIRAETFGDYNTRPVPADYDGDGKANLTVYHHDSGTWHVQLNDGESETIQFGSNAMVPIPSYNGGATEGLVYLAFGDSITYGTSSSGNGPETGYPAILELKLEPAFGGHFVSHNAGVPGETTSQGLARFEATLTQYNPDIVLIMEGTNDQFFQFPFGVTEANLRAMVTMALSRDIGVIIATIPPVISNRYRNRTAQMARILAFNPTIHSIAEDYNIPIALAHESITAVPGWEQLLMDQPTANHPNDAGYTLVAEAFFIAIKEGIHSGAFY